MRAGGCLCGAVRYEFDAELGPVTLCHCQYCRRAHGAPFVALSLMRSDQLRWVSGAELIQQVQTQGVGTRAFCRSCGTRLYNRPESAPQITMLVVESLDDDRGVEPLMHINLESKSAWYEIRDDLPCYPALPPMATDLLESS
ncbi:MAG: GFA family protein [Myxococcota bacterium]